MQGLSKGVALRGANEGRSEKGQVKEWCEGTAKWPIWCHKTCHSETRGKAYGRECVCMTACVFPSVCVRVCEYMCLRLCVRTCGVRRACRAGTQGLLVRRVPPRTQTRRGRGPPLPSPSQPLIPSHRALAVPGLLWHSSVSLVRVPLAITQHQQ